MPDLERKNAERNETMLAGLAHETGGIYYHTLSAAAGGDDSHKSLAATIGSRAEVKLIKGRPTKSSPNGKCIGSWAWWPGRCFWSGLCGE